MSPAPRVYLDTPLVGRESFERQADLFAAVLGTLDLPQVAVVTLSSGGPPGYLLAARHPDRIAAVVAISSVSGHYQQPHTPSSITQALFTSRIGEFLTRTMARRAPRQLVTQLLRAESDLTPEQIHAQADHVLRSHAKPEQTTTPSNSPASPTCRWPTSAAQP